MNDYLDNSEFFEAMDIKPASVTDSLPPALISEKDVKRLFDNIVNKLSTIETQNDNNRLYTSSQLFGKNVNVESLIRGLHDAVRSTIKDSDADKQQLINTVLQSQINTYKELFKILKVDQSKLIIFLLGFTYSVFYENNG